MTLSGKSRPSRSRILASLIEPSSSISEDSVRRTAQISLLFQLSLALLFLSTSILKLLSIVDAPVPEWAFLIMVGTYMIGRTKYYRISILTFIGIINALPYIILLSSGVTDPNLVFTALIWVPLMVLIASFLMNAKETTILTILNLFAIIILPSFITNMLLLEMGYLLAYTFTVSITIIVGSFLRERYLQRIMHQKSELGQRMNELEFLSSLLRHDLLNDLDIILRAADVIGMDMCELSPEDNLSIISASGDRMKQILSIFAQISESRCDDCIVMIEEVAEQAMKIHNNLKVEIEYDERIKALQLEGNRLLPMAFENILRNVAAYAGENPVARIQIKYEKGKLIVDILDNGPGIPIEVREHIFEREPIRSNPEKGQGLYLTKCIIESHGGTISLLDDYKNGAAFRIVLSSTYVPRALLD